MTVLCDSCSPRKGCTADKNRTECKYYQPMTNEEWFDGLSTEEKARWIAYQIYYATKCDVYSKNRRDWSAKDWELWLKQSHGGE